MTPIAKNIIVVDEDGNEYEMTYPQRARGLVKKGRARFIGENKICLACPPNEILERTVELMENNIDISTDYQEEGLREEAGRLSMDYVLDRIEMIAAQTDYLHECIGKLGEIAPNGLGDITGAAKSEALGNIVESREKTNQKLLQLYEKMYDDLKPQKPSAKESALAMTERILSNNAVGDHERDTLLEALDTIRLL
jgi:hypothetical protein